MIDRLAHFRKKEREKVRAEAAIDPKVAKILSLTEGPYWNVVKVEFPIKMDGDLTVKVFFQVKPQGEKEWKHFCYRLLLAGNTIGLKIIQKLDIKEKQLISDWIVSFYFNTEVAGDFQLRQMEALQRFSDILKAAR